MLPLECSKECYGKHYASHLFRVSALIKHKWVHWFACSSHLPETVLYVAQVSDSKAARVRVVQ